MNASILTTLVITGKGTDVAVRDYDPDPRSDAGHHVVLPCTNPGTKSVLDRLWATTGIVPIEPPLPDQQRCWEYANSAIKKALGDAWQAGPLAVIGRAIVHEVWIPIPETAKRYAFAFTVQQRDSQGAYVDWTLDLPVKDTYLVARAMVVVQET